MTPEDKDAIRRELEKRIKESLTTIEDLKGQISPVEPSVAIGRLSRMDAIQQKSMAEANLRSTEKQMTDFENVLVNLDKEDFGKCEKCQKDIPVPRILAIPEATMCISCASNAAR